MKSRINTDTAPSAGARAPSGGETRGISSIDSFLSGGGRQITIRCLVIALSSMLVASFQSGFFSVVRPFGIAPDLCLAFTVACGILFGPGVGAVAGISSGFFIDALSSSGISASVIIYFLCGTVVGAFRMPEPAPLKDIWRFLVSITAACAAKKILETLWIVLTAPYLDASQLLNDFIIRGIVCTLLFSPLAYAPTAAFLSIRRRIASRKRY